MRAEEERGNRHPRQSPEIDGKQITLENVPSRRQIIGRGRAADPFNCAAMGVDSNAFHLLYVYLIFAHPSGRLGLQFEK